MKIKTTKGDLPFHYDWITLAEFGDEVNMKMNELLIMDVRDLGLKETLVFILFGLLSGAKKAGVDSKVKTWEDVGELMNSRKEIMSEALVGFTEMSFLDSEEEKEEKGEGKKKA